MKIIDNSTLERICPAAFNESGPAERVSDRYRFVPTKHIIDGLAAAGYYPVRAGQVGREMNDTGKHFVTFESEALTERSLEKVGDTTLQIVLRSAHDGTMSHQISLGIYRLVCSNGMTTALASPYSSKIRHVGSARTNVMASLMHILNSSFSLLTKIKALQDYSTSQSERFAFAHDAFVSRFGQYPSNDDITEVLRFRRGEDDGDDAWKVLNRVQENLIRGGWERQVDLTKTKVVRELKSWQSQDALNGQLLRLADRFLAA